MKYSFLIGLLALLFGGSLSAVSPSEKPFVHGLFSDNMVLQRDAPCPVWGWTVPGATVTVEVAGKSASAVADASGKWEAVLEAMPAGGPYEMKITGPGKVTFKNVMTGDVWLCSGQSNMQMGMRSINQWWDEQSAADIPSLRLAIIPFSSLFEKPNTVNTDWNVSTKAFVFGNRPTSEGFSAIGFLFGRALNRELNVPVGLIESCWGATAISSWSSPEAVADLGIIKGQTPFEAFRDRIEKVWRERDPNFDAHIKWVEQGFDDSGWSEQNLPRSGSSVEPEAVGWYRKSIEIPAQWAGQELMISLPPVDGFDTVWWNGTFIDSSNVTDNQVFSRYYRVPGALVRAGRQTIAIRILAKRGLSGEPSSLSIKPVSGGDEIALAGPWKYNSGTPISELRKARYPERRNIETGCYQAMIAALAPFAIKGVIWYQGEGDTGRAGDYYASFSRMIADWRKLFRNESMPFYFVQLAGFGPQAVEPGGSGWASVRDAQRQVSVDIANTGMAVSIDRGEIHNIHPPNKQDVAYRLAKVALAGTYGKQVTAHGPTLREIVREGGKLRLRFDHAEDGLISVGGGPTGFAIAGTDGKFVWAQSYIDGNDILLSSPAVPEPDQASYGWADNPVCNVYNKQGFPAVPFQTKLK